MLNYQPTTSYIDSPEGRVIDSDLTVTGRYIALYNNNTENPSIYVGTSPSDSLRMYYNSTDNAGRIGVKGGAFLSLKDTSMKYYGDTTLGNLTVDGVFNITSYTIPAVGATIAQFGDLIRLTFMKDSSDNIVPCIEFKLPQHAHDCGYDWRITPYTNHNLHFFSYKGKSAGFVDPNRYKELNATTITHNAPVAPEIEDINNFKVGTPVFMNGNVYKLDDNGEYSILTDSTNCIPGVKSTGTYKEFLGICVAIHPKGDTVTVGSVMKQDVEINQDTIEFATHGDFYFSVDDSSKYKEGDTVLYDGTILDDEEPLTNKIRRMIVGVVTTWIDETTIAVFKS